MDIRKLKNECDNCNCEGEDDLVILSIANEIIILCPNCLKELKDLTNRLTVGILANKK